MSETLKHENYTELMEFVVDVYREYIRPGSELKKMLSIVHSPAPNSFQQAMIEVRQQDGGFGLSNMTAKDFFNNDLSLRQIWADEIAALYEAYKKATAEEVSEAAEKDSVTAELKALREQVAALVEQAAAKNKKVGEEGSPEEEASEPPEEAAAEGDTEDDEEDGDGKKPKKAE